MMNKDRAFSIVKTLSNSTHLQSEKDEAVRVVMETDYGSYQLSRMHLIGMIDYIYENYMKEKKDEGRD